MIRKMTIGMAVAVLAVLAMAAPAKADPVTLTLSGCDSCFGMTYTLSFDTTPTSTTATTETFQITLTIDTTGATGLNSGDLLRLVALKLTGGNSITAVSAVSIPTGWTAGFGGEGGITDGCDDTGTDDRACSFAASASDGLAPDGSTYTWILDVTVLTGTLMTDGIPLRVAFTNGTGQRLLSDTFTTEVPEPGTLILFGTGLLSMAGAIRRRIAG
ncbi:MAG TPA: PEP-CTERM sorting domain-containing protein [Anaerolineales bacterium]